MNKLLGLVILVAFVVQSIAITTSMNGAMPQQPQKGGDINKPQQIIRSGDSLYLVYKDKVVKITLGKIETKSSVTGAHFPGAWLDTDYNYRINITVTEPAGLDRTDWPVDVFVRFDPWANRQGITVMDSTGNNVTFQIWNTTGNSTHMASATITFLADVPAGGTAKYYIYYDTDPVGIPSFPTQVSLVVSTDSVTGEPIYTVSGSSYTKAILAPGKQIGTAYVYTGGKILEIDDPSGLSLYTSPMNDIGVSRNPSLYDPLGDANMSFAPQDRFIDTETQNGPLFIAYKIINTPIYDPAGNKIAEGNMTYRFYSWGWTVDAYVKWVIADTDTDAEYWFGVYSFDQDDGTDVVYDRVRTSDATDYVLGEGLPTTQSQVDYDWGKEDLTNNMRAFVTPILTKDHQYTVTVDWTGYVDLDLFIYSESGILVEGYDSLWDKIDGFVTTQDYTESEDATATRNERWIIVVLAYLSEGDSASFTVTVYDNNASATVATFSGSFASTDFIYTSRYNAYCNYYDSSYPDTIDETREGNVGYIIGGYAKRYFADDELVPFIIPMPLQYGDDYYIRVSWDLTYSVVHYHIFGPDGTEWTQDTTGGSSPLEKTLYPTTGGDYVVIIHYYDGSYYDADDQSAYDNINVELYFEPPFAETEDYSGSSTSWDWVAFYHHYYNRSIGFVNISTRLGVSTTLSAYRDMYWGNKGEGSSTDEDYILWALRFGGISAQAGEWIEAKYAVILAEENGYTTIEYLANRLKNPLQASISNVERFTLKLTINVTDGDNGPVVGALVKLINRTSGLTLVEGTTNSKGLVLFDIPRYDNYTLNITLVSANNKYSIVQTKNYSVIAYTQFSLIETYQFPDLVRITIQANDTEGKVLQDAEIRFNGTTAYAYTNLSGFIDVYIPKGVWNLTIGYKFTYDTYNLTYLSGAYVKNTSNMDIANVKWSLINITTGQRWVLIDLDAAAPPPLALELEEGSYSYDVYWGEFVYVKISVRSLGTLVDADNNVTYTITYADTGSVVPGFDTLHMNLVSLGIYDLNLSSSKLPAGYTYNIIIDVNKTTIGGKTYFFDALGNKYQVPQPLIITVTVKPRPTSIVVDTLTTNTYWDEQFYAKVYFVDALSGDYITGATATITLEGPTTITQAMSNVLDYYELEITSFGYPTGAYTITITIQLGNYSDATYTTTLLVNERPTEVFAPSYIEIPWSTDNHNITIWYNDSRRSVLVVGATGTYEIYDPDTQTLLASGSLIETTSGYIFSIPVLRIGIGTFTAEISLSKQYYEEKTFAITIVINPRSTYASLNATAVTIIWNETAWLLASYYDTEYNPPTKILGATATYKVKTIGTEEVVYTGKLEASGNDYLLTINFTENLTLGNYKIEITLFKENYTSQLLTADLIIEAVPTTAVSSQSSVELEWGLNISLEFWYNRTDKIVGVTNADNKTFAIYYGNALIIKGSLVEIGNGKYSLNINTTAFINTSNPTLGTYTLKVYLGKAYHENQTLIIPVTVDPVSTIATAQPDQIVTIWSYEEQVTIYYNRTRDNKFITSATITAVATYENGTVNLPTTEQTGYYLITIDTATMNITTYTITITIEKQFYQTATLTVTITIQPIPTIATSSQSSVELEWGLNISLEFWYNRTDTLAGITGATTKTYEIYYGATKIIAGTLTEIGNGKYALNINTTLFINASNPTLGTYTLKVYLGNFHYENQTLTIPITVDPVAAIATVNPAEITTIWGYTEYATIYYNRSRDGVLIRDASVSFDPALAAFSVTFVGQYYSLSMDTSGLDLGTYTITVTLSKQFHESKSVVVSLTVEAVPTIATSSQSSVELEWGLNISLEFWYNRTDTGAGVVGADNASFAIFYGTSKVYSGGLVEVGGGKYSLDLNTSAFVNDLNPVLGSYRLEVYLGEAKFENQTLVIPLTVLEVAMFASAQPEEIVTVWGYTEHADLFYVRARDGRVINASVSVVLSPPAGGSAVVVDYTGTKYVMTVNTSSMSSGVTYTINVTFSRLFFATKFVLVTVTVNDVPTVVVPSESSVTLEYGLNISLWFWYNRTDTSESIDGATTQVRILNGSSVVIWSGSLSYGADGRYYFVLNTSEVVAANRPATVGTYTMEFTFDKLYYESQTIQITLTITLIDVTAYAQPANISLIWGESSNISLYYMRKRDDTPIRGSGLIVTLSPSVTGAVSWVEADGYYVLMVDSSYMNDGVTYTINATFVKDYYVRAVVLVRVVVEPIPTIAVASASSLTLEYGTNVSLWFWYNRTDTGVGIPSASAIYEVLNSKDVVIYSSSLVEGAVAGRYYLELNTSVIVGSNATPTLGIYKIRAVFSKLHYVGASVLIVVQIVPINTVLSASSTNVSLIWSQNATITLYYIRVRDGAHISGATYSMVVKNATTDEIISVPYGVVSLDSIGDYYVLSIVTRYNSSNYLAIGSYRIELLFEKDYYSAQSIAIYVNVYPIKTYAVPNVESATVEYRKDFTFLVRYYTDTYVIDDATATYEILYNSSVILSGNMEYNGTLGAYTLYMNSTLLFELTNATELPVTLTVIVHLSRAFHESKVLTLSFTITPIPTKLSVSQASVTVRYGQVVYFWFAYTDTSGNISLSGAETSFVVYYNGSVVTSGSIPYNATSERYYLIFDTRQIVSLSWPPYLGLYKIEVSFKLGEEGKYIYQPQKEILSVEILPMEANLEALSTSVTIQYGEEWVFYFNYTDIVNRSIIVGAETNYQILLGNYIVESGEMGFNGTLYYVVFNSTAIVNESVGLPATYTIRVYVHKEFYEPEIRYVSITVEARGTYVISTATTVDLEYGDNFTFVFWYIDTEEGIVIADAETRYEVYSDVYAGGAEALMNGTLYFNGTNYLLELSSVDLVNYAGLSDIEGSVRFEIHVLFDKTFYKNQTKTVFIFVSVISTLAYAQPENITVMKGSAPIVKLYYVRARDESHISNASWELTSDVPVNLSALVITENKTGGFYQLQIISNYLGTTSKFFTLNITFSKAFYEDQTIILKVYIIPIPTHLVFSFKSNKTEFGDVLTLKIWYVATRSNYTEYYITGGEATLTFAIKILDTVIVRGTMLYDPTDKSFNIRLNTTELVLKASELGAISRLPVTFNIYVNATGTIYASRTNEYATLEVRPVATTVEVPATNYSVEWGYDLEVPISILRLRNLEAVQDAIVVVSGLPNTSYEVRISGEQYILYVNTTRLIVDETYLIGIEFVKPYYSIAPVDIKLVVNKVNVSIIPDTEIPSRVLKTPIIEETKTTNIDIYVYHGGEVVEDAKIIAVVYSVEAGVNRTINGTATGTPGKFRVTINWNEFKPGYKYTIKIGIVAVKVYGKWITLDKIEYRVVTHTILMDYLYGTTKLSIPVVNREIYVANMIFYPLASLGVLVSFYGFFKVVNYLLTPPEVREVNKLLRMIEKGVFEYKAPRRKEYIYTLLKKELGVEVNIKDLLEDLEGLEE